MLEGNFSQAHTPWQHGTQLLPCLPWHGLGHLGRLTSNLLLLFFKVFWHSNKKSNQYPTPLLGCPVLILLPLWFLPHLWQISLVYDLHREASAKICPFPPLLCPFSYYSPLSLKLWLPFDVLHSRPISWPQDKTGTALLAGGAWASFIKCLWLLSSDQCST